MLVALRALVNGMFVGLEDRSTTLVTKASSIGMPQTFELVDRGGQKIALRSTDNGKFVRADDGSTKQLCADRDIPQDWETFEKVDLGGQKIGLRCVANGKFVCAENAGVKPLIANRAAAGDWEAFHLVRLDAMVALRSMANNAFVGQQVASTSLIAKTTNVTPETFEVVGLGGQRIALRSNAKGKFVCAEEGGTKPLGATRDAVYGWETFEKVDLGSNKFGLRASTNGKFVCAEDAGAKPLIANRDAARGWETFEFVPRFSPAVHGFKFQNDGFANDFIPALNVRTDALCGGMAYAALDYFFSKMPIPDQPFRPASQTTLRAYIYDRQVASIMDNLDKWSEYVTGVAVGLRNTEFFNWGISSRIAELRYFLDQGIPCVICLMGGHGWGHQVVAYSYTMGRYDGNLGNYVEDFKIHVYDPNFHDPKQTIVADRARGAFRREGFAVSEDWLTYFVDTKYHTQKPPTIANATYPYDGLIYELVLLFCTGSDDLRGGNDNINLTVNLLDGSQQTYNNINSGGRWVVGSKEYAQVVLQRPIRQDQLRNLMINATFGGGPSPDNWEMMSLEIFKRGGGFFTSIKTINAKRFMFGDRVLIAPINDLPSLGLSVAVHLQGFGDQAFRADEFAGTRGQSRQLEGFAITFSSPIAGLGMEYFAHLQFVGDTAWMPHGSFCGTRGEGRRVEGFGIRLTGPLAGSYDVEYMAYIQNIGDTLFVKNGVFCGTRGQGLRVEGIQVRVLKKQ